MLHYPAVWQNLRKPSPLVSPSWLPEEQPVQRPACQIRDGTARQCEKLGRENGEQTWLRGLVRPGETTNFSVDVKSVCLPPRCVASKHQLTPTRPLKSGPHPTTTGTIGEQRRSFETSPSTVRDPYEVHTICARH